MAHTVCPLNMLYNTSVTEDGFFIVKRSVSQEHVDQSVNAPTRPQLFHVVVQECLRAIFWAGENCHLLPACKFLLPRRIRVSPVPTSKCRHVVLGLFKKLSLLAFAMKSQVTHTSSLRASWKASRNPLFTCATRSKLSEALFALMIVCSISSGSASMDMVELYRSTLSAILWRLYNTLDTGPTMAAPTSVHRKPCGVRRN